METWEYVVRILKSLWALYGISIGTYDGTVIRYLEGSTEVTAEGIIDGLLLGDWIVSVVGLAIDFNKGDVLVFWYGKVIVVTLWDLVGLQLDN